MACTFIKLIPYSAILALASAWPCVTVFAAGVPIPPEIAGQILSLKKGAILPREWIEKYDSRELGRLLVQRHRNEHSKPIPKTKAAIDFLRETRIELAFHGEIAGKLIEKGILNLFQTGKSNGIPVVENRRRQEAHLLGLNIASNRPLTKPSDPTHVMHFKSAYMSVETPRYIGSGIAFNASFDYGSYVAVLKDEVKSRSLWTEQDSLSASLNQTHTFYDTLSERPQMSGYFEALILGELDLTDIEYFMIPHDAKPDFVKALMRSGLPIYEYEEIQYLGRARRIPRKLLTTNAAPHVQIGILPLPESVLDLETNKNLSEGDWVRLKDGRIVELYEKLFDGSGRQTFRGAIFDAEGTRVRLSIFQNAQEREIYEKKIRKLEEALGENKGFQMLRAPRIYSEEGAAILLEDPRSSTLTVFYDQREKESVVPFENMDRYGSERRFERLAEKGVQIEGLNSDAVWNTRNGEWLIYDYSELRRVNDPHFVREHYRRFLRNAYTEGSGCRKLLKKASIH